MTFKDYQTLTNSTAIYPNKGSNFLYPLIGIMGEAGEVAEKIKKIWRDKENLVNAEDKLEITKEIGDVLWYLSQLSSELEIDFEEVANLNIEKIKSRLERRQINGSGDNR